MCIYWICIYKYLHEVQTQQYLSLLFYIILYLLEKLKEKGKQIITIIAHKEGREKIAI